MVSTGVSMSQRATVSPYRLLQATQQKETSWDWVMHWQTALVVLRRSTRWSGSRQVKTCLFYVAVIPWIPSSPFSFLRKPRKRENGENTEKQRYERIIGYPYSYFWFALLKSFSVMHWKIFSILFFTISDLEDSWLFYDFASWVIEVVCPILCVQNMPEFFSITRF